MVNGGDDAAAVGAARRVGQTLAARGGDPFLKSPHWRARVFWKTNCKALRMGRIVPWHFPWLIRLRKYSATCASVASCGRIRVCFTKRTMMAK